MAEKFYLTKEGLENLKKEFADLEKIKLAKAQGEVPKIMESDEMNPDYLILREDIELLDARLAELQNILENAEIIKTPKEKNIVDLGAKLAVDVDGKKDEFTIVGTYEANPAIGKISNESPVGRALLGHKLGEEVIISSPIKTRYKIKKIKYS
jgi:transcription elongation factor GreA